MGHLFQDEWWERHPSMGVDSVYYANEICKGYVKGFGKAWGIN